MKKQIILIFCCFFYTQTLIAKTTVLFLGDSLTEGYGLEEKYSYPSILKNRLQQEGYDIHFINAGISGSTSASALSRLQWYAKTKIDIAVLALGANDGLRGIAVHSMEKNLSEAIEFILDKDIKVVFAGMKIPPNYGIEYAKNFSDVFPRLAKKYKITFIPFLLDKVAAKPHLNLPDGIHPNKEGYKIVAENVYQYLKPLIPKSP